MRRLSRFNNTGRTIRLGLLAIVAIFGGAFLAQFFDKANDTNALSATEFQAGRIIDDSVFYNPNTMTADEIDAFIDSHTSACDTWGTQTIGSTRFYGVAASNNTTRADYMKLMRKAGYTQYHDAPFICVRDYYENPTTHKTNFETGGKVEKGMISAGQIIYNAAHEYGVNPQVLLVMLKKESYAWGDDWPLKFEYNTVMGYGCPDNAACDEDYYGFYNQVMTAAWQLKYYREHPSDYRYRAGKNVNIYYSPDYSCGTKNVYIENSATAGLYIYTPYTPNDAALRNYPGTSYCGSYGNRNFYMYFREWFGSTRGDNPETGIKNRLKALEKAGVDMGEPVGEISHNETTWIYWQEYENGFIVGSDRTGYWESMGPTRSYWQKTGFESGKLGFPKSSIQKNNKTGIIYQEYENGYIVGTEETGFWESMGGSREVWRSNDFESGKLGFPTSAITTNSETNLLQQTYTGGTIEGTDKFGYWIKIDALDARWLELGGKTGSLGKFKSGLQRNNSTSISWIEFENGFIVGKDSTGYWESMGKSRDVWKKSGFESGTLGFPVGPIEYDSSTKLHSQKYEKGIILESSKNVYHILPNNIYDRWAENDEKLGAPVGDLEKNAKTGIYWVEFKNGFIVGKDSTGYWESSGKIRDIWRKTGFESGTLGFPVGPIISNSEGLQSQEYEKGIVVESSKNVFHIFSKGIYDYWKDNSAKLGAPVGDLEKNTKTGIYWVEFKNGFIVGKDSTGYWESIGGSRKVWKKSGFESGTLGFPVGALVYDHSVGAYVQPYEKGYIVGNNTDGYHILSKKIYSYWKENSAKLGAPIDNLDRNQDTGIYWVEFKNGFIVGKDSTGYWESIGGSRKVWKKSGFESGTLGFPVGALVYDHSVGAYVQPYEKGYIVGNNTDGYHILSKKIYSYWKENSAKLGAPIDNLDRNQDTGIYWVEFKNGFIVGKDSTGYWESSGKIRDIWRKTGFESGKYGFPTGAIIYNETTDTYSQKYEKGTITAK